MASGSSIREIASCLQRAASTVSREIARHGGRPGSFYRTFPGLQTSQARSITSYLPVTPEERFFWHPATALGPLGVFLKLTGVTSRSPTVISGTLIE